MKKPALLKLLKSQGIISEAVLNAIDKVPRELFVPETLSDEAYANHALPIGFDQTISQPYIVARMTEIILRNHPRKILEIGTGSGYQAAVLSHLVEEVYTIERVEPLLEQAQKRFNHLNMTNIHTLYGDGFLGWPEYAPYDAIIVTAAHPEVPSALFNQLKSHGQLLLPLGEYREGQELTLLTKETFDPVAFVPLLHDLIKP